MTAVSRPVKLAEVFSVASPDLKGLYGRMVAGAASIADGLMAVGLYGAIALVDYPALGDVRVLEGVTPRECAVEGVQCDGGQVFVLTSARSRAHGASPDWGFHIDRIEPADGTQERLCDLAPGIWRHVRGGVGPAIAIYRIGPNSLVRVVDGASGSTRWEEVIDDLVRVDWHGENLIALSRDATGTTRAVALCATDGRALDRVEVPEGLATWTCALPGHDATGWWLGGSSLAKDRWAIARTSDGDAPAVVATIALTDVWGQELLARRAETASCCGWDVGDVANLAEIDAELLLVALGGSGVGLGACHSACAVALIPIDAGADAEIEVQLLSSDDGAAAMGRQSDGRWLLYASRPLVLTDRNTWRAA